MTITLPCPRSWWSALKALVLGQRLYVCQTDGTYCLLKGVRKLSYFRSHMVFQPQIEADVQFVQFHGLFGLKGEFRVDQVVSVTEEELV